MNFAALPAPLADDLEPVDPRVVRAIETIWQQSNAVERAELLAAVADLALRWLRKGLARG